MNQIDLENIDLAPEQCVTGFGTTIIVAPHADDESLGCGGLIALLRKYGQTVYILLLSDGTLSHPNSEEYPAEKLMELREKELINATSILGVPPENIIFSRYKDRSVPDQESPEFKSATENMSRLISIIKPKSIFLPWRRDPHPDHRAAYQIVKGSNVQNVKLYEYPIWLKELGNPDEAPLKNEVMPFRLDIKTVLQQKQDAVAAHISQTTGLINDDPEGFMLSPEMIRDFSRPYETFLMSV